MEMQSAPTARSKQIAGSLSAHVLKDATMKDPDPESLELPSHLLSFHNLLRQVASRTVLPDPPEHLYHQTLERCLASCPNHRDQSTS